MSKKIMLINADQPEECRAVILDDGKVENFIVEHASHEQIKGNIYLGVINRVEPAIEAAFVDFGGKKFGFMPFKDVLRENYLQTGERKAKVRIQDVLIRGQKLMVQVVKEGRDHKGPSLSNGVSIPGRFLVLVLGSGGSGISRKIEDEEERKKLRSIVEGFDLPDNMGVIIRTAGVGRTKLELQKDLQMLLKIWETLNQDINNESMTPPYLLYKEADMVLRTVRDHFTADTDEIIIDNKESYKAVRNFIKMIMPRMQSRVKLYQDVRPLFEVHGVEEQIETIYHRTVHLPSGGSIVIDVGEAMVSIDVNSGKTTSSNELESTAVRTNMEAADEVSRQLRLRDLGGLIVIDFIDMFQKKNKMMVEKQLKKAFKKDKARINLARISKFGLMEMSRQRMSPPVKEGVFEKCPRCKGAGYVRGVGALSILTLRKIQEIIGKDSVKEMRVDVSSEVVSYLLSYKMEFIRDLKEKHKVAIHFDSSPGLEFENFKFNVIEYYKEGETPPKTNTREPRADSRNGRGRVPDNRKKIAQKPRSEPRQEPAEEVRPVAEATATIDATEQEVKEGEERPRSRGRYSRSRSQRRSPQGRRPRQMRGRRRRYTRPESGRFQFNRLKTSANGALDYRKLPPNKLLNFFMPLGMKEFSQKNSELPKGPDKPKIRKDALPNVVVEIPK
ncbi:MAG: Rne/Rng family ribonuclease [Candidatus Nitrohelix vancouverensis]|uniref:Ribonuclease G n=1 Tax=Candidatus Nitrohelix vancouverensis TaxID=2705534 RepID=A0A7T0C3X4_9BACT|nr:MAG: Rne/Rng family ribonuclease [Candidatus Nitrohelix vancouverensis]